MTYKYYEVRRQIYENCSDKSLNSYRTFSDMKKLFKKSFWAILILMLCCLIGTVILSFFSSTPYIFLPIVGMISLSIFSEIKSEKLYVPEQRKVELKQRSQSYIEYIKSIKSTLEECGLTEKRHWQALKTECEKSLTAQDRKYAAANNKVFDMLIGVPLGALISSIIFKGSDAIISQILSVIVIGLMIIAFMKVVKKLRYYSDGYFKDQYLFNVLSELEYTIDE